MPTNTKASPATPDTNELIQLADRVARLTPESIIGRPGALSELVDQARHALGRITSADIAAAQTRMTRLRELVDPAGPSPAVAQILGIPCFRCIHPAQALRAGGRSIDTAAEAEQAATLHYLLGKYVEHGAADWWLQARDELGAMAKRGAKRAKAEGTPA